MNERENVLVKIYTLSDIHGCLKEFEVALAMFQEKLDEPDTMLVLCGDYVHGGSEGRGVLSKIIDLQYRYGSDRVVAILGNHDEWVIDGTSSIDYIDHIQNENLDDGDDDNYMNWLSSLPRYYVDDNHTTIFTHAGIDEDAGEMWEWATSDNIFTSKYPAETGKIEGLDGIKVVAGHVGTSEIAGDPGFHDIYMDESHIYIDGTVLETGVIPVLMVDTEKEERYRYYRVTETGVYLLLPYDEEN